MLALEPRVAPLLTKGQPVPVRLTRLSLYPATWLLHGCETAPEAELLEYLVSETMPTAPPPRPNAAAKDAAAPGAAGTGKESWGEG